MLEVGIVVVIILAVVVSFIIIRRSGDRRNQPVEHTELPEVELSLKLQEDVRALASRGHTEHAIKMLRKATKLAPHEATLVVQALMVGQSFPAPETPTTREETPSALIDDDLLERLHTLVAQDPVKRTAAMQLLRDRTGMSAREARRFINAL
ncbi:hypothetical protein EF847_13550 [Actinobacteria bacterium YIM 96077]|uniref:Ribosomal protein L7/L12 C-terminal domain-containing protein n=1 Tax=Phytoactinopolyspora halophila TaxID=1981511 RepID=A0A329QIV3_9ACTN|nr:hypothetical protein [Phytoactinopolyspora halophila]AYY13567.1 hypothetical protein EF847_13550 [Actinobacteria bacterium YIM 96077]RAW12377.1 hypothetical protein DPM12_14495 [Phytoactinopolyspora halophila]